MFEIFGNSEEVKKLKKSIDQLYRRVEELDKRVNPPDGWNLKDAIYGRRCSQPTLRSTWGLWKRLSELEKCVFGHEGNIAPEERSAVYVSLKKLEAERCKETVQNLLNKMAQLERQNRELLEEIKALENILIKSAAKGFCNLKSVNAIFKFLNIIP